MRFLWPLTTEFHPVSYTHLFQLRSQLCKEVVLIKLIPGMNPKLFDALIQMACRGVVIEAFGIGGL